MSLSISRQMRLGIGSGGPQLSDPGVALLEESDGRFAAEDATAADQTSLASRTGGVTFGVVDPAFDLAGDYLSINGTSSYVNCTSALDPAVQAGSGAVTLLLNIVRTAGGLPEGRIYSSESASGNGLYLTFASGGSTLQARLRDGTTVTSATRPNSIVLNTDSYVAVRVGGGVMTAWSPLTGSSAETDISGLSTVTHNTNGPRLGQFAYTVSAAAAFRLKDFVHWGRYLSDAELSAAVGTLSA